MVGKTKGAVIVKIMPPKQSPTIGAEFFGEGGRNIGLEHYCGENYRTPDSEQWNSLGNFIALQQVPYR
jgi:hypothetical protein